MCQGMTAPRKDIVTLSETDSCSNDDLSKCRRPDSKDDSMCA